MKILIWFVCIFIAVSIQVICKMNGILLGGIPTILLFGGTWLAASRLCSLLDQRPKRISQKSESTTLPQTDPPMVNAETTDEPSVPNDVAATAISNPKSRHTKNTEQKRFCKYCGSVIDNQTRECTGCKKKYVSAKRVVLRISLSVAVIAIISATLYGTINYSNAINAKNSQHFVKAMEYYDNLFIPKSLFPDDYAYVQAGALMERGYYIEALRALEALDDYDVPASIINSIKAEMYAKGQSYYNRLNYAVALDYFAPLGDYQRSDDYRLLIKCHGMSEFDEPLTDQELKQLFSMIGFEDTASVVLATNSTAISFLEGNWGDGYFHFRISQTFGSYKADHNLPITDEKDTFKFRNSQFLTYPNGEISLETLIERNSKPHFSFYIIDRNTIYVYCFSTESTHVLYRK